MVSVQAKGKEHCAQQQHLHKYPLSMAPLRLRRFLVGEACRRARMWVRWLGLRIEIG